MSEHERERWARVAALFDGALAIDPPGRTAWLEEQCAGDATLRDEIESLLAAHGEGIFVPPLDEPHAAPVTHSRIGPFRLIEPIGSGGMGTVFLAEREGPDFVQRVALKVIRAGRADPLLAERLRAERRILARLEHPNIARLIDGGVTPEGQPYFAMEYVAGTTLPQYCNDRRLTVRERLRLFLRICEAVQHAHAQLVVHRDLKPSNILVTEDGHPKLLDFGIARLLAPTDDGLRETTAAWVTPAYASPEQARGEFAGVSSDVYALGILLYELLTGTRPYDVEKLSPVEAQKVICDQTPVLPSARIAGPDVTERAQARSLTVDRLRRDLAGDLDHVVLKALAKEPARRYASAAELGEDVRRHLDARPVLAQPDSAAYRASRFVSRHRAIVAAIAIAAAALLVGSIVALWQAQRATEQAALVAIERDRARGEAEKARLVAGLMGDLFRLGDPTQALGDTITARQVLDEGSARIERELADQPELQATLLSEVARVYANLGLLQRADTLARRALTLREAVFGAESVEVAESMGTLGAIVAARGDAPEAITLLRRAVSLRSRLVPDPDTITGRMRIDLGWQLRRAGDYDAANAEFTAALEDLRAVHGIASTHTAPAVLGLASTLHDQRRFDEAEALFADALAAAPAELGRAHPMAATALLNIGMLRRLREGGAQAEPLLRSAWEMRVALFGEDHPATLEAAEEWGRALHQSGRVKEAERVLGAGLARSTQLLGPNHPSTAGFHDALGAALLSSARYAEAAAHYDTALAVHGAEGREHPEVVFALIRSGEAKTLNGELAAAEAHFRRALDMNGRLSGSQGVYHMLALHGLGRVAHERGRVEDAAGHYDEAAALAAQLLRPDHRYARRMLRDRGTLRLLHHDAAGAAASFDSVARMEADLLPSPHHERGHTQVLLARARLELGDTTAAVAALDDALAQLAAMPDSHPDVRTARRLRANLRAGGG